MATQSSCQDQSSVTQLGLDFNPRVLARSTDPETSHEAARGARMLAKEHEVRIWQAFVHLERPLAAEEIAEYTGLDSVQVNRRLVGLERKHQIERTNEYHINRSGVRAMKWRKA